MQKSKMACESWIVLKVKILGFFIPGVGGRIGLDPTANTNLS